MKIDFAFFSAAAASHFRAVSLQYKKTSDPNILEITRSIGWRRAYGYDEFGGCQRSQLGTTSPTGQVQEEITGIPGTFPSYYTLSHIEDSPLIDRQSQWCFGHQTFTIELNGVTSFTHTGNSCCTIPFLSDTGSIGDGATRYTGKVEDVTNDGPSFDAVPIWIIMEHCEDQVYRVFPKTSSPEGEYPLKDPEGDEIRCKWATEDEAAHFAYRKDVMKSFLLDEVRCTVTYRPEFDKSGPGNKPIALMVEDWDTSTVPHRLLHASPAFFIAITFQPDLDEERGFSTSPDKLLYSESYPEHDEDDHDYHERRRRTATFSPPSYCDGKPKFIKDEFSKEQKRWFKWNRGKNRGRREVGEDSGSNLITIPWAASYEIGSKTLYDFPRYQFTMPEGMTCTGFDDRGEATCTWLPTAAQALEGSHSHCAQIYDPYGRGSERLCITIAFEIEPECQEGYEHVVSDDGQDVVCADINECLDANACGSNSSCENNDGGYVCNCDHGFMKDDTDECVLVPPMEYSDAVRTLKTWINMTSDVLADHGRVEKFTLRTGKLARNALNSIDSDCEVVYNDEKYQGNDFAVWDRDHERSDDYCIQTTQMKEGFQAFINNYSCKDGKKAKQVKRVSKFIEKINNPYC